jgi:TIR domain
MAHAKGPRLARRTFGLRIRVILSYAHHDEKLRDELAKHLAALRRSAVIDIWYDRKIVPGDELDRDILERLQNSDVVLLLISPDFMNSDYCYRREMRIALRRHARGQARVIPIILRPVDWHGTPIGKLSALPKDGRPVTTWRRRDEALLDVAKGVRRAAEELRQNRSQRISTYQGNKSKRKGVRTGTHAA